MIKVGITGNIACGKSASEQILLDLGYKVIDADRVNHLLLSENKDVINEVKHLFSDEDIVDENGNLSREKIGKIVFSDKEKLKALEVILHKKINEEIEKFINENSNEEIIFISMPLLFETNQEQKFDKIIFISANEDIRLERLILRNKYTKEYAKIRIQSQDSEEEKIKKSDYVIYNNSDFESLKKQIEIIIKQILFEYNKNIPIFDEYFYKNVGLKIRKYRKMFNLTQEQLSEILGLNYKYIGHVERCERKISLKVLMQIIEFFKIQPSEFFSFDEYFIWNN